MVHGSSRRSAREQQPRPRRAPARRASATPHDMPSERWLITGALGCIGAWCCRQLVREGHAVMAFDPQTDRRRWELVMSGDEIAAINHVSGDITEIEAVERTLAENDTTHLVHLAAM